MRSFSIVGHLHVKHFWVCFGSLRFFCWFIPLSLNGPNTPYSCGNLYIFYFQSKKESTLLHTFDIFSNNNDAGPALVAVLRDHMPTINMEKIMRLEFTDLEEDMEYPAVWFTAAFLPAIWERRQSGTRIRCYEIRAEIEGKISLLRETRFSEQVEKLKMLCRNIAL